jgi:hypothetical protein
MPGVVFSKLRQLMRWVMLADLISLRHLQPKKSLSTLVYRQRRQKTTDELGFVCNASNRKAQAKVDGWTGRGR